MVNREIIKESTMIKGDIYDIYETEKDIVCVFGGRAYLYNKGNKKYGIHYINSTSRLFEIGEIINDKNRSYVDCEPWVSNIKSAFESMEKIVEERKREYPKKVDKLVYVICSYCIYKECNREDDFDIDIIGVLPGCVGEKKVLEYVKTLSNYASTQDKYRHTRVWYEKKYYGSSDLLNCDSIDCCGCEDELRTLNYKFFDMALGK